MLSIFDSHPVQYKAPIYQRLQQLKPDSFQVIYATDSSVRGHHDQDFGRVVAWNTPLLQGYPYRVLHNERGIPLQGFRSLTGRGIYSLLRRERPAAVLISQFLYEFDFVTYVTCLLLGIPVWIRHETQDEAFRRPAWKRILRSLFYRFAHAGISHAFAIGQLNREHLLRHGLPPRRISSAPYCSPVEVLEDTPAKQQRRDALRKCLEISPNEIVVLFSGKWIEKKNPLLLLDAFSLLSPDEQSRFKLIFLGSGELEKSLQAKAAPFPGRIHFAGFINQSEIAPFYLAADILVLPSRRAGETWGLVVNEALQAGCAVIVTDAVGCHREFGDWERVRVIGDNDSRACAQAMRELATFPRSFDWCAQSIKNYSVESAAIAIARQMDLLETSQDK